LVLQLVGLTCWLLKSDGEVVLLGGDEQYSVNQVRVVQVVLLFLGLVLMFGIVSGEMSWEHWQRSRHEGNQTGMQVAPSELRRPSYLALQSSNEEREQQIAELEHRSSCCRWARIRRNWQHRSRTPLAGRSS
jgi:hypothetical protein